MSNLESCSISTVPGFAAYFHLNDIRDIYIDLWKNSPHFPSFHGWPNLPDFRNLHSLDLRGLKGDLDVLSTSIAKILFNDGMPTVTALGLDLDDLQGGETTNNLFLDIFAEFDRRRRAIGRPDLRLNLRDLMLGKGMYHPSAGMDEQYDYKQWRLSKLLDVTKLRTLRLLNDPCIEGNYWEPYETIHLELFDGITALQRVSVEFDQHRDALMQLSKLRILMFSYATVTISGERSIVTTCKEDAFNLAKRIFTDFQEHAKKQKRDSSLRYVGIDVWVFTCIWLPSSELNDGRTGAEIVQLDEEEARTFDFIRMNEKLEIGKYRLGRR
ncbi:hypothetical protein BOTNAR_0054g00190 [Botryotinia narcissicola]|uniref:Uncharacterized protein n=1 Tax=Botryotinia narcissicola TaxID=278944 RepID=A0A4Z1J590_9HELO|nr:hypothetical protein BOTNAR_0054g00190 [Botryotinia narcissicola]